MENINNKKIKVSFVLPTLKAGGAERVMSFIAQNLDHEKFKSSLVIIGRESETSYDIDNTKIIYLNKPRVLASIGSLIFYLKNEKPDIVISAISHLNIIMAFISILFPKTKFVGREVNVLSVRKNYSVNKNPLSSILVKYSYRLLDKIICQSNDMAADMEKNYSVKKSKIVIINNPINDNCLPKKSHQVNEIIQFITVGSLELKKGHYRIIEALSKLNFPFHYTIVGNGSEKENIFKLIKNLKIEDQVTHIPFTKEVPALLNKSDIFLQGSFVEGFPNALLESCAVGTPAVVFKAPGGINEIIEIGVNGFIAENEKEFVESIIYLKNNYPTDPIKVSQSVHSKYNKEVILNKYQTLFLNLLN